jgi:hypothetical protein
MNSEVYVYKLYFDLSEIIILNTEDLFKEFTKKYSTRQNYPHNIKTYYYDNNVRYNIIITTIIIRGVLPYMAIPYHNMAIYGN